MDNRWMAGWLAAASMSCMCIARGTRVSTPAGPRRVEQLAVGDELIAVNPDTGEHAATVLVAVRKAQRECGALGFGSVTLTVTSDHPLFDPDTRQFHPAGDWLRGARSHLLAFDGQRTRAIEVTTRQLFVAVRAVFDLTVAHPWHTFVAEGLVVHNKSDAGVFCALPDGGLLASGGVSAQACACAAGTRGVWSCESSVATCVQCGQPLNDAGP